MFTTTYYSSEGYHRSRRCVHQSHRRAALDKRRPLLLDRQTASLSTLPSNLIFIMLNHEHHHHRTHTTSPLLLLFINRIILFDHHSSFVARAFCSTNRYDRGVESSQHETPMLDNNKQRRRSNTNNNSRTNWEARSLRRRYQHNGNNILYKKSILTTQEVTAVNSALQSMNIERCLTNENASRSFATNRKGMSISSHDEAGAMLYDIFGRVGGGSMHALVKCDVNF